MKRKTLVKIHLTAALIATLTIVTFIVSSLVAEIQRDEHLTKKVKEVILFSLPVLVITMPTLGISGNMLAGKSKNAVVLGKQTRMKFILINGIILIVLASFLYYRSHYKTIDSIFFGFQIAEFAFGLANLTLIGINIKAGLQLSGKRMERQLITSKNGD